MPAVNVVRIPTGVRITFAEMISSTCEILKYTLVNGDMEPLTVYGKVCTGDLIRVLLEIEDG